MILYLDTSSFAKIYVSEPGSDAVKEAIARAEIVATSLVAYPEMRSALARRKREGTFSASNYRKLILSLKLDWKEMTTIALNEAIVADAGNLAERHALRGLDAIHLASAVFLKKKSGGISVFFLTADEKLNVAAHKEGLSPDGVKVVY